MRWTTRGRLAVISTVAFPTVVAMMSCGVSVPLFPPSHTPAEVKFEFWVPSAGGKYSGHLQNSGLAARNVRVEVWYADAAAETAQIVVPLPADIEELHGGWFTVSPQVSNGESRYPRVGTIAWDGGTSPGMPREPSMLFQGFYCYGRDSLIGLVSNGGGWAYHVSVALEDRSGIHTVASWDPFPPGSADITCVPRDSSGVRLPPWVLFIRWEDYGGIPDSLMTPAVDDTLPTPCG